MKINQLFKSLTDQEKLELADEIRAILKYERPKGNTPLHECVNLMVSSTDRLSELMTKRLFYAILNNHEKSIRMGWMYETITEKELRRLRGFGNLTIAEFINLRNNVTIIYD